MSIAWRERKRATKIIFVFQKIIGLNAEIVGNFFRVAGVQKGLSPYISVVICPLQEFLTWG